MERLQGVIAAQRDVMDCGFDLQRVMDVTTVGTRELTSAAAAVLELREGDHMVYRSVSGTAEGSLGTRLDLYSSLSGRSVLEARILTCVDAEIDVRVDLHACRKVGARSMVCVPLVHEDRAVGVLKVYSPHAGFFGEEDVSTLQVMVGFISAATASSVSQRALSASEQRFRAVAELASDGMVTVDAQGRIVFGNQSAMRIFGYTEARLLGKTFAELLPDRYNLVIDMASGRFDAERLHKRMGPTLELLGKRADGSEFPMEVSASSWSTGEVEFFTGIVRDVSERKRLEAVVLQLAQTDHLTNLLNRRAGEHALQRELARAIRYHHDLSFVLIDIDHFKRINDTAGHAGGDHVLRRLGALISQRSRSSDVGIRWGGEEFLVVLTETDGAGAREFAESVRSIVSSTEFEVVQRVTVSVGVATRAADEQSEQSIARADAKLYAAKNNGRNRVEI